MVKDHYPDLGFEPLGTDEKGNSRWSLTLGTKKKFDYFMKLQKGN
jgi:hypothetical protein